MLDDYELIDVMEGSAIPVTPQTKCAGRLRWVVYIPRELYDANLSAGQETLQKAQQQFRLDMGRCKFFNRSGSDRVPQSLLRYCTQSVMALPIELLSQRGVVGEVYPSSPMRITLHPGRVIARKRLWLVTAQREFVLNITVCADDATPTVSVCVLLSPRHNGLLRQFVDEINFSL